jgi:hypothetical protein
MRNPMELPATEVCARAHATLCGGTWLIADVEPRAAGQVRWLLQGHRMRAWVVSLGVAIQLGAALTAHALDGHRRVTQYAQTHFTARDGMPHSYANALVQTADGYLWATSQEGLLRFDGAGFTTFDHRKSDGVPTNVFTSLAVDAAGTLWAGTYDHGLLHVVGGEFHAVAWEPGPQEQAVRALAFDAGGDLWIGMRDRGVVRLHAGVLAAALTTHDGLPSDDVRAAGSRAVRPRLKARWSSRSPRTRTASCGAAPRRGSPTSTATPSTCSTPSCRRATSTPCCSTTTATCGSGPAWGWRG